MHLSHFDLWNCWFEYAFALFKEAADKADQIAAVSEKFYGDLEKIKQFIIKEGGYELDENGKLPFQSMDKTDILDEAWFTGDRLTKEGDRVMAIMEKYKSDIKAIIGDDIKYQSAVEDFEKRFDFFLPRFYPYPVDQFIRIRRVCLVEKGDRLVRCFGVQVGILGLSGICKHPVVAGSLVFIGKG